MRFRPAAVAVVALVALTAASPARAAPPSPAAAAAAAGAPVLSAPEAILVEPATGDVVYQRRAGARRPMASTTKLMTALLLIEHRRLTDRITAVPYDGLPAESIAGLHAGERLTVADMLRALLLASANDAAAAIAVNVGGSERRFVRMMNARARSAGLRNTHYANPIGLDSAANYSTATDLVKLALLLRRNAFARDVMDSPRAVLRSGDHRRVLENRNTLVAEVPWMNGVKTGHTQRAGYILVGSASRGGVPLVSAVLGTPSEGARNADTLALMRYGFAQYARPAPLVAGRTVTTLAVDGRSARARIVAQRTLRVVIRRGERLRTRLVGVPKQLTGPLPAGTRVGAADVIRRGRVVASTPLVTATAIAQASFWHRNPWAGPTLGLLALCAMGAALAGTLRAGGWRRAGRRGQRSETA